MAPIALEPEDHSRDAAFNKAMHGKSAASKGGLASMFNKDRSAHKAASEDYWRHWDDKLAGTETEEARRAEYATLTRHYYNLATDLYEYGWGSCFHFCRFAYGEGFYQAIARHEHYLAHMMQMREGMRVLDVGCGVGGPAREIAKFTGAKIVGLNNNDYQIERATHYAAKEGLSSQLSFTKGDFMQMSFPSESFDAVYAIEATVHAPSLEGVYSQIYRVLKPGGVFGVYEWLMTEAYNNEDPHHREIRLGIEQGDGISNMVKISEGLKAIRAAGFNLEVAQDLADSSDARPWYYPLDGDLTMASSLGDLVTIARMTRVGRFIAHGAVGWLERFGLAPKGTRKTADSLGLAADCLVAGGKENLFTPMYLMIARKPAA
ncbi:Delta(24)-sterol C-methyltransferase [Bacidia gigantensis]|uniref:Delta(24)-sterol C-methyltransferase n=1 Tax=Bacidia gigantensis TaxID=2732470 RepID=UPI001D046996|nr:Delta(24)-sterol C-methyltransferase [Bacidia gigantensis]KAG8530088.1 Delta(24)-sterol C-methyltransferase [Bacidia gigantensis]